MHALALNITANITQNGQGFGIIAKIDTNFLKDRFGIVFNDLGAFVAEDIKRRNLAGNKGVAACWLPDDRALRRASRPPPRRLLRSGEFVSVI